MRLIDADTLKQKKVYSHERHEYVVPVAEIDWASTADVAEVKHGIWIGEKGSTQFSCSMCGTELYSRIGSARWKFCPECGSRNEPQYNGGATR